MFNCKRTFLVLALALIMTSTMAWAEDQALKPFVLASSAPGSIEKALPDIKTAVEKQGFEVAGEYTPYKGAHVVVVTSEAIRQSAAKSDLGAYGAVQRISLTESGADLQVAYTNPLYFAQAYRMADTLADTAAALERALGKKQHFGSKEGLSTASLRKYHYMVMMPYFTDQVELASYGSQEEALAALEAALAKGLGGTAKVYRVDLKGKAESVIGIAIKQGSGADATVMKTVDMADPRQTAHLPYEVVVSKGKVYMLHGKFRIALDFPDLTMGTFMKISSAPGAIENALKAAARGK